ncbi:DUF7139 domain-containing protein [Halonotius pteroides]|uniref:Ribonuclease BN n=1 Tax=Halonotius pteroides TaxID=268735 RepID=A0A3A6PXA6_9EURY|nr:ribonuclease BN [Halonotius pteroides]RJX48405.1 ribonuclease BN [Halonotius pteroides]
MTALSDAYSGTVADQRGRGWLYLGVGLFGVGAILVVAGIVAAGSGLLTAQGYSLGEARWLAGVLGGIGVPAVFLGIVTILPAGRTTRGAALIGASIAVFGVALFAYAYPCQWIGNTCATGGPNLTLPTAGVYFLGTLTTFWCLFTGVANFKTRNDPGGTVRMEIRNITRQGDGDNDDSGDGFGGLGGVGFFGTDPDGNVATQTNAPGSAPAGGAAATSDGGATTERLASPLDEPTTTQQATTETDGATTEPSTTTTETALSATQSSTPDQSRSTTNSGVDRVSPKASRGPTTTASGRSDEPEGENSIDRYCGSCAQFKYVRTDSGIKPYCAHHDELMDDMESCDAWEPR